MKSQCPVCRSPHPVITVERSNFITMQNYVYKTPESAQNAPTGTFALQVCGFCGFGFNGAFNHALLAYDENYNNNVPSTVFEAYYKEIAKFLYETYDLENKFVIDVGCGKGNFLKILCDMYNVRGLGIDPSFEGENTANASFIADVFKAEYVAEQPALIICRHVLEHIEYPVEFLTSIGDALKSCKNTPFFLEVPDIDWTIENFAFWDFCYEHCNYFSHSSLTKCLNTAGFSVDKTLQAFGNQYIWAMGAIGQDNSRQTVHRLKDYAERETAVINHTREHLMRLKQAGQKIVVWGMATKGVVYCDLIDTDKNIFDYCVDINKDKINCYTPRIGHKIESPEVLRGINNLSIIVMNPNYQSEIAAMCERMDISPTYLEAQIDGLTIN